jgi:hypothetical protein
VAGPADQIACCVCLRPMEAASASECRTCGSVAHHNCGSGSKWDFRCNRCLQVERIEEQQRSDTTQFHDQLANLSKQVSDLERAHEDLKHRSKPLIKVAWGYAAFLLLAVAVTGYLVYRGHAQNPEVAINYNVGEIIGGLLAGGGIAVAGVAYAIRSDQRPR